MTTSKQHQQKHFEHKVPETKGVRIEDMELLFKYGAKSKRNQVRVAGNTGNMKNGDFGMIDVEDADDGDQHGLIQSSDDKGGAVL